jgi:HSP20 family protein
MDMVYRASVVAPAFGLRREIDRLFEDVFATDGRSRQAHGWTPAIDVRESAQEVTLTVEIPGLAASDVEVTAHNGVLTVRGEKRETRQEGESDEKARYHVVERKSGRFARSFALPAGIDDSKITADYANGVMTIHVPKAALPEPRRIAINA